MDADLKENQIHPTAIIGPQVKLGRGNVIGPFVNIIGDVTIGDNNWFGSGVIIGALPEHRSVDHLSESNHQRLFGVHIENNVVLREAVQVHQGFVRTTLIGSNSFIMNQSYIAHDCEIGTGVTMASSVLLAGHVSVLDGANLGMATVVHQGLQVGQQIMAGMASVITSDIPNFALIYGNPARIKGANKVGLLREGFHPDVVEEVNSIMHNKLTASEIDSQTSKLLSAT